MLCFVGTRRSSVASRIACGFALLFLAAMTTSADAQSEDSADDGPSLRVHLQETRSRLDEIKAELRRMQARLKVAGAAFEAAPQADIAVSDAMSGAFVLTGLHVWLDGAPVYERDDDSGVLRSDLHLLSGPIATGDHEARITVRLRGDGTLLPYMRAYRFEVHSTHKFSATPGQIATVCVRAFERGNPITPYVQLPALEWSEKPFPRR
jgi:hypothetical protein